ncbi:E3 SUMO-protein ligase KIAA1586-like [Ptychodera flava]|uniref:E3 SUMO-protein ligase KIAA1586-like n=1 Tax=Ptychodera flava TaxID=63121 RepID=UPI003969FB1F
MYCRVCKKYNARQKTGQVIREEILEKVKQSNFVSLLIDETTDISIMKQLIIYSKYLLKSGESKVSFLGIEEVCDGRAETLTECVKTFAERHGIVLNGRLCGLGRDGAAVMIGKKSGVATRLKHEVRQRRY